MVSEALVSELNLDKLVSRISARLEGPSLVIHW